MTAEETRQILKERAAKLAETPHAESPVPLSGVVVFRLAQETYAIENRFVTEVHPLRDLTPLPCVPRFVAGMVNLRGSILPVIDLKQFFGLPEKGITDLHRIICVHGNEMEIGFLCDSIEGSTLVDLANLHPPPSNLEGEQATYLQGIAPGPLIVLSLDHLLSDPKLIIHEEVHP